MTADLTATSAVLPTYARTEFGFVRGEGVWVYDERGRRYLDLGAGIAVNALGHCHPALVSALTAQAQNLWHTSNLYRIPEGERLAARLAELTFADVTFFTNSGAEALECAIKMARKHFAAAGKPERNRIVTFAGAFHGRTLATISAGGNKKYLDGFGPDMPGFDQVPWADHEALQAAIGPETAAVLIEPIQGEGGIRVAPQSCLRALRELCDERGMLLIYDEVQCGVGRTGKLFAYEGTGAVPDIMTVAKGIGGGFPMGACLATRHAASGMTLGTHGSTFGGNPLAMAIGNAVLDIIARPDFLAEVRLKGGFLRQRLAELKDRHPGVIEDVRGEGLMLGLKLTPPCGDFVKAGYAEEVLTVAAADNVVRLLPALTITEDEMREAVRRLDAACARLSGGVASSAA